MYTTATYTPAISLQPPDSLQAPPVVGTRKNILGLRRVLDNLGFNIGDATSQAIYLDECGHVPADLRRDTSLKYKYKPYIMSTPPPVTPVTSVTPVIPVTSVTSVRTHLVGTRKNILGLRRVLDNLGLEIGKATAQAIYLNERGYVPADLRRDTSLKYTWYTRWNHPATSLSPVVVPVVVPVLPVVEPVVEPVVSQKSCLVSLHDILDVIKNIKGLRKVLDNAGYGTNAHTFALYLDKNGIVPADLRRRQDLLIRYKTCPNWLLISDVRKFKQDKALDKNN